jgi:dihydroorotate dehydrogenase (fumarate)
VVTDLDVQGIAVEHRLWDVVKELKRVLKIPIAVKLPPFFSAFGNVARQLDLAGADGVVMFNRFYQPYIDIRTMEVVPRIELSTSAELLFRLRWAAILHGRVRPSLAVSGGVATPNDGIKAILAGADAVQIVSGSCDTVDVRCRHAPWLEHWMEWNGVPRLEEMRGRSSLKLTRDPAAFERASYIRTLQSWDLR